MSTHGVEDLNLASEDETILLLASVISAICDAIAVLAHFFNDGISDRQKCYRLNSDADNDATGPGKFCSVSGFKVEYILVPGVVKENRSSWRITRS